MPWKDGNALENKWLQNVDVAGRVMFCYLRYVPFLLACVMLFVICLRFW